MVDEIDGKKQTDPLCTNCYAKRVASAPRLGGPGKPYAGLTIIQNYTPMWTGEVRYVEKMLLEPLKWKTPARIFVNSMSDLFHPGISFELIDEAIYVMQRANWHLYQVLTKRVARMAEYRESSEVRRELLARNRHIHWGISVGTNATARFRMPIFENFHVPVRWLSMEPLLEDVNLSPWLPHEYDSLGHGCWRCGRPKSHPMHQKGTSSWLKWIVTGGESGPADKIRSTPLELYRSILSQSRQAGIPYFQKQLSEKDRPQTFTEFSTFPLDLQVREYPVEVG